MYTSVLTRMEEDLQLLGLSEKTQETYLYRAKKIIEYFNKPPEQITDDELRSYFLYLNNDKKYARDLKQGRKQNLRKTSDAKIVKKKWSLYQ